MPDRKRVLLPSKRRLFCIKYVLSSSCLLSYHNKGGRLIRAPLCSELHLLERFPLISIWSVSPNLTRRCIIEARCRLCGALGGEVLVCPEGTWKNSYGGQGPPKIAGVWVERKCGCCYIFFLGESGNVLFLSSMFCRGDVVFFSFFKAE